MRRRDTCILSEGGIPSKELVRGAAKGTLKKTLIKRNEKGGSLQNQRPVP